MAKKKKSEQAKRAKPIDEGLLELVRDVLADYPRISEKRMFGGLAFLGGNNLFLGVRTERLMVRVGPERYAEALTLPSVQPMRISNRTYVGYVHVYLDGLDEHTIRSFVDWGAAVAAALPIKPKKKR